MPPSLPPSPIAHVPSHLQFTLNPANNIFVIAMATPQVAAMWEQGFSAADATLRTIPENSTDPAGNSQDAVSVASTESSEAAGERSSDTFTASQKQQLQELMMRQILQHNETERVCV
ncbi:hypothetical protein BV25DRAFT_1921948 [Artomyces pyxidatus]|uniref:Uncharacterized protein n=1 Tax=Artomyces pyxidatus TaxID=48021 RepID=A0ACB8SGU4_9AGAM|nr:hypothetical protein BV25DRAFT_1921948 [Artomyces pyxidatus]